MKNFFLTAFKLSNLSKEENSDDLSLRSVSLILYEKLNI